VQTLTPSLIIILFLGYFAILILVSWLTSRKKSDNEGFFMAGRNQPWWLIAFAMIGTSISGVTFISVPGAVGAGEANQAFSYLQMVLGYLLGYLVIGTILMPVYYKMKLTSIYGYLEHRLGKSAYLTGAGFFILSRTIGTAFRMFLVASVMQEFVLGAFGIPFWLTSFIMVFMIWIYTFKGGLNTIIYTDVLMTTCFLLAVVLTIQQIGVFFDKSFFETLSMVKDSEYSKIWFFEGGWGDANNFWKQFISGALITTVMTGMDQDLMQKNLTCKSLKDAQKNMFSLSIIIVFVNILFLSLGALLYLYAQKQGITIPDKKDHLYPLIALQHGNIFLGVVFILGFLGSAYASGDSALTSLTTSFCVDFLGFEKKESVANQEEKNNLRKTRTLVHLGFTSLLAVLMIIFHASSDKSVINLLFKAAGFTYGPLLGLFAFGLLTKRVVQEKWVLPICIIAPIISFILDQQSANIFNGFKFGFLILAVNGLLTFLGLYAISRKND
jgi:Na+/proline symporter